MVHIVRFSTDCRGGKWSSSWNKRL